MPGLIFWMPSETKPLKAGQSHFIKSPFVSQLVNRDSKSVPAKKKARSAAPSSLTTFLLFSLVF